MSRRVAALAALVTVVSGLTVVTGAGAQGAPSETPSPPQTSSSPQTPSAPPLSLTALVDQVVALFPQPQGEVVEVNGASLTLSVGASTNARPGLVLEVFREGHEIRHPRTGQVLGRAENVVGSAVIERVFDAYSIATFSGPEAQAGDRVRVPAGKVKVTLLSLAGAGVKADVVEAATNAIYEALLRTGRLQLTLGEQIGLALAQQGIKPEEVLGGRGVREAAERFKAENILALVFRQENRKPFVDVRLFSQGRPDALLSTAFFVPPSIKPPEPGTRFSTADRARPETPEKKPRSFLARLLGGDRDSGAYSSAAETIPLKEIGRFGFLVVAMDVAVAPADRVPRVVLTDGDRIYLYRIVDRELKAEWTYYARSLGRTFSVQLADLDGDGSLEVIANRFDSRVGMNSLILGTRNGKPVSVVDEHEGILLAVDERGTGVNQTLWSQRYDPKAFFTKGQADQMALKNGKLVKERAAIVPPEFRATGATFSNVTGKGQRALAFIDAQHHLRVTVGTEEQWRSTSVVGGGSQRIEVETPGVRGGRSDFYEMEPVPLAVDLDGDGVQEIIVPQNKVEGGYLGVIYRGPAGLRFQQVASGFEGTVAAIGAVPGDGGPPTLVAAVLRYKNFLRQSGETQLIMTTGE
jgi:hypothetical protein